MENKKELFSFISTQHSNLGPSKSLALPLFHSLTGCDTTSQCLGCGKKTAWAAWTSLPDLTDTLLALTEDPTLFSIYSLHMQRIERFVVLMYSKGCGVARENEAGIVSSPMEADHWKTSHLPKPLYSSM